MIRNIENFKKIKKIILFVILMLYYFVLLEPALSNINRTLTPNRMHMGMIVYVLFSINGIALSALYTKKYDVVVIFIYKFLSFFLCHYFFAVDDLIFNNQDLVVNIDLFRNSISIFTGYFSVPPEGVLFLFFGMLFFFSMYVAVSVIPFIFLRMIKNIS